MAEERAWAVDEREGREARAGGNAGGEVMAFLGSVAGGKLVIDVGHAR
jgi:hypothetical protein